MTRGNGWTWRWILPAAVFLLVLTIAGCGMFKTDGGPAAATKKYDSPGGEANGVSAANGEPTFMGVRGTAARPREARFEGPTVNVFGEFDGQQRVAAPAVGEGNFQQHTFVDEGADSDVSVDRTGKWLVFASTRHSENAEIYMQRVDGQSVTQLTSGVADNAFPCFSPDGKKVAFCSTRAGNWNIYEMDADGRNVVQVTSGPTQDVHPSFSPDGTRLAYSSLSPRTGQWELWTVNLATHERKMIGFGLFPAWSPAKDVDRIAFQKARQRGSRWFSLWTLDLVDGEARRVTEVAVSTNAAIVSPSWSPDGQRLAFATIVEPARTHNGRPQGQQDVWTIVADGGNRRRLTDGTGTNLSPFWAADDRVYFVSDRGGTECVWSVQVDSEKPGSVAAAAPKHSAPVAPRKDVAPEKPEVVGSVEAHEATR